MWSNPTLSSLATAASGTLKGNDSSIGNASTDTRTLKKGDVYFALQGPSFDGHQYIDVATAKGASALVVSQPIESELPVVLVKDTRKALGFLAQLIRNAFEGQVIALTGSVGKTSTRAMLKEILSMQPGLLSTHGNFNNDIGVPKTWFELSDQHQRVLLEMGANAQGEIDWLCQISKPHISLLLNAGESHTEGFGGLEGVRKAKGEIIEGTDMEGGCVLNQDDPHFGQWLKRAGDRKVVSFGRHTDADVCLLNFSSNALGSEFTLGLPDGDISVNWPMYGLHMAMNAAAAAATAWLAGVSSLDIAEGLSNMKPEPGRLQPLDSTYGGPLIHDAYNANPVSYKAAIDVLADLGEDTILVAGDMAELGDESDSHHRAIGQYARGKVKQIFTVGHHAHLISESFGGQHFSNHSELIAQLSSQLDSSTAVLVKGSRSAGMERVVDVLKRIN
ncbi:UDP-N-acetylmuramoyl-tripeptide--D-alanyl-D-alanine ligase [Reinekea marina]|uniref:UDP-N-acetylmuramoyl-tripeptide--D-alanyl-D-alanine ligase n=1 Tax=Reinekea marina TaxID=1310421 RepID=A0ABV7WSF8_9GAMM|nr:UDP-N-acetylmuramoyl-tripeptide--D-alanyl-D-alanine ligase [Reinekea marina]MDN3650530.1 UDP-N-acetylmuramoyl-tripeptide--D-alanyl-D-alanine ligase [Reinekea marina]